MSADVEGGMWVAVRIPEGRGDSTSTSAMGDYDCRSLNREVYEGFCQAPSMWWDACQAGYGQIEVFVQMFENLADGVEELVSADSLESCTQNAALQACSTILSFTHPGCRGLVPSMIRIRELAAPEWELDDWDDVGQTARDGRGEAGCGELIQWGTQWPFDMSEGSDGSEGTEGTDDD
ncbi:hypothetical protein JCM24511_01585 [Saitozyma sp. JCM 24511]|nr:hypothetical protein JCM24511_01585 [Saitozyma sp. JCM 24511]